MSQHCNTMLIWKDTDDFCISQRTSPTCSILIALSVLIPPLWPLALVLTLVLLYPETMKRIGLIGGAMLLILSILLTGGVVMLGVWLVGLLF